MLIQAHFQYGAASAHPMFLNHATLKNYQTDWQSRLWHFADRPCLFLTVYLSQSQHRPRYPNDHLDILWPNASRYQNHILTVAGQGVWQMYYRPLLIIDAFCPDWQWLLNQPSASVDWWATLPKSFLYEAK